MLFLVLLIKCCQSLSHFTFFYILGNYWRGGKHLKHIRFQKLVSTNEILVIGITYISSRYRKKKIDTFFKKPICKMAILIFLIRI